ncbi:MAG: hypothetical protein MJY89_00620 [Bacteroidales bacterium]|nr:hypothetical protein [Bacteroidales bacterium]
MKRKLIDLDDSTFEALSSGAAAEGTNLKNYIEDMLDERARLLEDSSVCQYRLSSSREPTDKELSVIMDCAAEAASRKNNAAIAEYFADIERIVQCVQ